MSVSVSRSLSPPLPLFSLSFCDDISYGKRTSLHSLQTNPKNPRMATGQNCIPPKMVQILKMTHLLWAHWAHCLSKGPIGPIALPLLCHCDLSDPQPRHFTWGYALTSNSLHLALPLPTQSTSPTRTVSSSRNSWWGGNPQISDQGEDWEKDEMP